MKPSRYARVAALLLCAAAAGSAQGAQPDFPTKPVRLIVPFAPGGGTDIIARMIGQKLADAWGQSVIVDNRGGAGGTLGTAIAAKAQPDGYTMLLNSIGLAINAALYRKLPYDTLRDLAPVSLVASQPNLLVVHPSVAANTVEELIKLAKWKPGALNFGSGGAGGSSHLAAELFRSMAGIEMTHVPYKGTGPALVELAAGQVHLLVSPMVQALSLVRAGRIKALAVTGSKRSAIVPDLPTLSEAGVPGYEFNTWYGMLVPAATPKAIIARMNRDINRALASEDVRSRLAAGGMEPLSGTSDEFARYLRAEIAKWAKVINEAKLRAD